MQYNNTLHFWDQLFKKRNIMEWDTELLILSVYLLLDKSGFAQVSFSMILNSIKSTILAIKSNSLVPNTFN